MSGRTAQAARSVTPRAAAAANSGRGIVARWSKGRAANWFPSVADVKNLLQDLADRASAPLDAQVFDLMASAATRMPGRPVKYQELHDRVADLMRGGMGANEASRQVAREAQRRATGNPDSLRRTLSYRAKKNSGNNIISEPLAVACSKRGTNREGF